MNAKQKLAQDRTDWAEDRTILAAERTFAGWVRTGLTVVLVAIGLQAVFDPAAVTWLPKAVASLFLLAALFIFVAGWSEARATHAKFTAHACKVQPMWRVTLLSVALGVGTVGTGVVLWLL